MNKSRFVMTLALATVAGTTLALPPFVGDFQKTYKVPAGSALAKANCATCHIGMTPKLNPYGQDLKKAMATLKTKKLTADVLKKIEKLDSDKDGVKNGVEIKKGTLPGDPKSK
ncbi:MAG TPA: c-type cytochrome [Armatimonadota bacterium]|jgi:mono/diheme cytochrome c family protein